LLARDLTQRRKGAKTKQQRRQENAFCLLSSLLLCLCAFASLREISFVSFGLEIALLILELARGGRAMPETRSVSNTDMISAVVVFIIGLLLLLGWYFFPNW
jgi:hypothetical protein